MFERFTNRARRVIVVAQDTAREMGHAHIAPEHLLVGLLQGEGLAAAAMTRAGIDDGALRERVAACYESDPSARKVDKVPFSVAGKRSLEQALRAAVGLGHSYIGTEHLFLGVEREGRARDADLDGVLGVPSAEVHRLLVEMMGGASPAERSPALQAVLNRAVERAGTSPMTTGHVLSAMLADPDCQASHALAALGVDVEGMEGALEAVPVATTSDASPVPQHVAVSVGETTMVVTDPEVATALGQLSAEELRAALQRAVRPPAGDDPAG